MNLKIRKVVTQMEEIFFDGKELETPIKKVVVSAVIKNNFTDKYHEDLSELSDIGEYLGEYLTNLGVKALSIDEPSKVQSYGKGAIIGTNGELEHGAAILHPKLGKPMRDAIGGGKSIIPSAKKIGGPGTTLDVPLHYKDAAFVRTHYDAIEVHIPDAPRENEIVVSIALTDGGRPNPRIGGLLISEVKGEDGLR